MKQKVSLITAIFLLFFSFNLCADRVINHNAVVISGYEAYAKDGEGEPTFAEQWNDLAFWTDIYRMWEILYVDEMYNLQGMAPDDDNIRVFYGPDAMDCTDDKLSPEYKV